MEEGSSVFGHEDSGDGNRSFETTPQRQPRFPDRTNATASSSGAGGSMATSSSSSGGSQPAKDPSPFRATMAREEEEENLFVSEFGFEIDEKEKCREETYVRCVNGKKILRREIKWANMASEWNSAKLEKLKRRCRKGVPTKMRSVVWQLLLGSRDEMVSPSNKGVYEALKRKRLDSDIAGIIERDLGRTFPTHVLFKDQDGIGQTKLRSILHAYACIDPEVGYVQGMGFLVGTLLTQMEEEESFWAFHAMMNNERYRLRDMYRPGFPMLQMFFFQLKKLLADQLPKLFDHFENLGVDPSFFASQWFLTLFVYHFQFRSLLRIWDIFMCEGWKEIFRVAIGLMRWEEKMLLQLPFDKILPALKALHEDKDPDEIVDRSLKVKFKTEQLLAWRAEYEAGGGMR